jgi:V/A-type H+-transporting ATPase subunit C
MPDFPYINARVRAMRARLLDSGRLEELLAAPTFDAFLQLLATTPYGADLQEALTRHRGLAAVDEALARHFHATTQRILGFADGRPRTLIEAFLRRWDLANVRALLRGKHTGRSPEEIAASLWPAGTLGEVALRELARQPDIPAVVGSLEALGHPFAIPLAEGLAAYAETRDLLVLELRLDRFYAWHVLQVARGGGHNETVLRELVQAEIDAINVKTALKLARLAPDAPAEPRAPGREGERLRFFIPGGALTTEELFLLLSHPATLEQGWRALRVRGFPVARPPEDLTAFEKTLDQLLARGAARLYLGDPLGLDVVVGYLALKYNEVVNLRLIARSKALGLPRDLVRREMVLV